MDTARLAAYRATALLRQASLRAQRGSILVPLNPAQQLYDVITITDPRFGIDHENHRIIAIQADYDRHNAQYTNRFTTAPR